jgi:hypothetical protein
MRVPAIVLLVLGVLGLAGAPRAQDNGFADADFGFNMTLPDSLHALGDAERAVIMGLTEAEARNVPRSEAAAGTRVAHHYFWVDRTSPYNRQMDVHLFDGPPPYMKPEDLVEAYTKTGLKVDVTEPVKAPVGGLRLEGTFTSQQGVSMRKTIVYVPDRAKYAIVSLQCFAGDWAIVQPEFLQSVLSIRLARATPPGATAGAPAAPGKGPRGRPGPGGARSTEPAAEPDAPIDWTSLPVTGSLVLGVLLLAHLLLGGRGPR